MVIVPICKRTPLTSTKISLTWKRWTCRKWEGHLVSLFPQVSTSVSFQFIFKVIALINPLKFKFKMSKPEIQLSSSQLEREKLISYKHDFYLPDFVIIIY